MHRVSSSRLVALRYLKLDSRVDLRVSETLGIEIEHTSGGYRVLDDERRRRRRRRKRGVKKKEEDENKEEEDEDLESGNSKTSF